MTFTTRGIHRIRIRRVTADSATNSRTRDEAVLAAIDTVTHEPPVLAQGRALFALTIRSSEQLTGIVDTFNLVVRRLLPSYSSGAWQAAAATSNAAWMFASILRGPGIYQPVPDSDIDGDALEDWAAYCVSRGYTFNGVFDSRESVWAALGDVAAVGRATPIILDGNTVSVVVDRERTTPVDLVSPRDSYNFRGVKRFVPVPHAIMTLYRDGSDNSYDAKEITVYDEGRDENNSTDIRRLELFGTTNLAEVHKRIRYTIAESRLRPEEFEVSLDVKQLAVTRGDYVDLIHDVSLIGLGQGRVVEVESSGGQWTGFTLDANVALQPGQRHNARFQGFDGSVLLAEIQGGGSAITPERTVQGSFS